jgi:hypothetical protein
MKLNVIVEEKRGVISITSEQFIIEELKAHICQKMGLEHSEYKTKVVCGSNPSLELIKNPAFSFNTTKELISDLDIQKVFTGTNNNGAILAYLYLGYLIQNDRGSAIITKPKRGWLKRDSQIYNGMLYIETYKYLDNHEPLYEGKQTALYKLIEMVDKFIEI